jgi:hypothetical protein
MTMQQVASWQAPRRYSGPAYSEFVLTNRVAGAHSSWTGDRGESSRAAVADFLIQRARSMPQVDLSSDANFLYVLLSRARQCADTVVDVGDGSPVAEFGFGSPPASPEDWPCIPVGQLLRLAIEELSWSSNGV